MQTDQHSGVALLLWGPVWCLKKHPHSKPSEKTSGQRSGLKVPGTLVPSSSKENLISFFKKCFKGADHSTHKPAETLNVFSAPATSPVKTGHSRGEVAGTGHTPHSQPGGQNTVQRSVLPKLTCMSEHHSNQVPAALFYTYKQADSEI